MSAVKFFYANAGYSYNPATETKSQGRWRSARALAAAEREAQARGWSFRWEWDDDADLSWMDEDERAKDHEVLGCILATSADKHAESLWGIVDASRPYARVIEAELAYEHLATLRASIFEAI